MKKIYCLILFLYPIINCYSQSSRVYLMLGLTKADLKDYSGAIADFNDAIEINPKAADSYFLRGLAKLNISDKEGACLDLSKAGELGNEEAYDWIKKFCQ